MAKSKTVSLYLRPDIEAELDMRGDNRSQIINRDLERLYAIYRRALRETPLTVKEACLIVDALNGILIDAATAHLLWANIEDAIKLDGLTEKWGVDGKELIDKLRGLSAMPCMALADAAERFWSLKDVPLPDAVRQCFNIK